MSVWFLISIIGKRNDVADIAWGLGFIVAAVTALSINHPVSFSAYIVTGLVVIWGSRLSIHIGLRNIKKPEDSRYNIWRKSWGKWFYIRSYLQVFMLQGLLMLIVVSPVLLIATFGTNGVKPLLIIGVIIWLFGFIFESIGDRQLKVFIGNPINRGHIMMTGLWKYTRHPNYFGEITQWWAIAIIGLSFSYGWIGIIGAATITYLILKVSGVPLLEKHYEDNPEYQSYKQKTSVIIPLPAKK